MGSVAAIRPPGIMSIRLILVTIVLASALGAVPVAEAHTGGKAEPQIAAGLKGRGLTRDVVVRLTDVDDGDPINGATVTASASMTRPHAMQLAPQLLVSTAPGTYEGRLLLVMPSLWTVRIAVTGQDVVEASSTLRTRVDFSSAGSVATKTPPVATLPTRIADTLVRTDYMNMAVLWIHGLAAMGWILGVLVMAVALASEPALLNDGVRLRLSRWYRRSGAWLHWAFVPVIVATGIYNMLRVTPFSLAWTPNEIRRLADIPYGVLYEAILMFKLGLFGALLISGSLLLVRTTKTSSAADQAAPASALTTLKSALGAPGLVYLSSVPLILAAAMALRYVHVLSHVAVVLNHGH